MAPTIRIDDPLHDIAEWRRRYEPGGSDAPIRLASHRIETPASEVDGQSWPMHAHRAHELLWGIEGPLTVSTAQAVYTIPGGASIWIPADVPHEVHAAAGSSLLCSWLAPDDTRPGLEQVAVLVPPPLLDQVLSHLMQDALDDTARRHAEAFALDLLVPTPRLTVDLPLPSTPWVRVVTDAILRDPADPRTIEEWAADAKVSVRTLTRRFRSETGLTISDWRQRARIRFAMQRLSRGDGVATVARATGFRTAAAFGASFRRMTGVTPGSVARRASQDDAGDRFTMEVDRSTA